MTTYEYFQNEATHNRNCAQKAETRKLSQSFLADANKWERRAGMLTPEIGGQDVDSVILWRVIKDCDDKFKEKKEVMA